MDAEQQSRNRALRFVFYLGAANADATPEQRSVLHERIKPMLAQFRQDGKVAPLVAAIRDVMGLEWQPTGQWARAISAFTPK